MKSGGLLSEVPNVAAHLPPEELKRLARVQRTREKSSKEDPLNSGFPPHVGQLKIHQSTSQEILLVAGNRFGKSTCGMREALWRATGTHPYKQIRPHHSIWCGFPDYNFFLRTTQRLFRRWVPRKYLIQYNRTEKWAVFRRADGGLCELFFVSYEVGREGWQGGAVDFMWLDEECPYEIYEEATARLIDSSGDMLISETPISGLGWTYDTIYVPFLSGSTRVEVVEGALAEYLPECECGHLPEQHGRDQHCSVEGCACQKLRQVWELGVGRSLVPHLSREQILRFARSIKDPLMRLIRIFGKYKGRSGGVFPMFDPRTHVVPAFKVPSYYERWGGVDPGFNGFAAVFGAQDPYGRTYIVGEYFSQHESTAQRAQEVWAMVKEIYGIREEDEEDWFVFYVDTEDPQTVLELNIWAQSNGTRLAFVALDQGLKARKAGIGRMIEHFMPDPKLPTPVAVMRKPDVPARPVGGEPRLYLFDTLRSTWLMGDEALDVSRLVWEINRARWKKVPEGSRKEDLDDASAGGAHMLSATRYFVMARLSAPEEPEEERLRREGVPAAVSSADREVRQHLRELQERYEAGE